MLTPNDIIHRTLSAYDIERHVKNAAARWTYAGASSIRSQEERAATLSTDALVGLAGQYAGLRHLFGVDGIAHFARGQWRCNIHGSDQGHDVDGANVDFKTSRRKTPGKDLLSYNLAVRPNELRKNWIYIQIIMDLLENGNAVAHILGWARSEMLPSTPATGGIFAGAHVLPATQLKPLMPTSWAYYGGAAA